MRISSYALDKAIETTQKAQTSLEECNNALNTEVMVYLNEWNDKHLQEYFNAQSHFNTCTELTIQKMDEIARSLRQMREEVFHY